MNTTTVLSVSENELSEIELATPVDPVNAKSFPTDPSLISDQADTPSAYSPGSHPPNRKKFSSKSTAMQVLEGVSLSDCTILITGCTAGIGTETARALTLHGAHVVMANRNVEASEALRERILREAGAENCGPISIIHLDLSSLASVKRAAEEFLAKGW